MAGQKPTKKRNKRKGRPRARRSRRRLMPRAFASSLTKTWKRLHPETRRALNIVGAVLGLALVVFIIMIFNPWLDEWQGDVRTTAGTTEPSIPNTRLAVWTRNAVYLRKEPSQDATSDILIPVSSELRQIEQRGSWSLVETEGTTGYIELRYLTMLEPLDSAADVLTDVAESDILTRAQQTELLARVIYSESGNQTRLAQIYTGSVVLNRAGGDPDAFERVIFRPGAFDVVSDRSILKEPSTLSRSVATELMTFGSRLPEHVLYFHRYDTDNAWTRRLAIYVQEDEIVFCYLPGGEDGETIEIATAATQ